MTAPDTYQINAAIIADLVKALEQIVDEKVEYMTINLLGDPETQHTVKIARAALARAKQLDLDRAAVRDYPVFSETGFFTGEREPVLIIPLRPTTGDANG